MPSADKEAGEFLSAWMGVRQIVQAANFNGFRRAGLSATQFMTLNVVPKEGLTLTELARGLNLSPASLKKTVDSLEQRGMLLRRPHPDDARKLHILSTAAGDRLRNAASGDFQRFIASLFQMMQPAQRKGLVQGLESLIAANASLRPETNQPTPRGGAALPAKRSSRRSPAR